MIQKESIRHLHSPGEFLPSCNKMLKTLSTLNVLTAHWLRSEMAMCPRSSVPLPLLAPTISVPSGHRAQRSPGSSPPSPLAGPALPHSSEHQWERRAHWAPLSFSPPALRSAPDFHRPPISDLVQSSGATFSMEQRFQNTDSLSAF